MEDAKIEPKKKDSTVLAAIAYVLNIIVAVLIYLIAKEDKYARFHALQAILFSLVISAVAMVLAILGFIVYVPVFIVTFGLSNLVLIPAVFLVILALLAVNLYLAYMAYQGRAFMLPFVGKIAKDHIE